MSCKKYLLAKAYHDFYENNLKSIRNPTLPNDRSIIKDSVVNSSKTDLSHYSLIRGTQLPEKKIMLRVNFKFWLI